jgi:nitrite reductase/ring-hydroxylating ferredoxin subunit
MSETLVRVCSIADVAADSVKAIEAGGEMLAVYNVGGTFYVTDDACTHGAASLADGVLDGEVIECAMHFGAFHIPTGKAVQAPCSIPIRTYKVVVRGGDVFIDPDQSADEAG